MSKCMRAGAMRCGCMGRTKHAVGAHDRRCGARGAQPENGVTRRGGVAAEAGQQASDALLQSAHSCTYLVSVSARSGAWHCSW